MARSLPLRVFPRSASADAFTALHSRLQDVANQLVDLPPQRDGLDLSPRMRLLEIVHEYKRSLRFAEAFRYTKPSALRSDDHDWLASYLLYRYLDYDRLSHDTSDPGPSLLHLIHETLAVQRITDAHRLSKDHPRPKRPEGEYSFGILTALPHEYHSILRRLDLIECCTGAGTAGFELLNRASAAIEPPPYTEPATGWCVGRLGRTRVLVLCTGSKGKLATTEAVKFADRLMLGFPQKHWVVAGICATTNDSWPIGTVLVSTGLIYNVRRTHSQRFETIETVSASQMTSSDHVAMSTLFRRPPADGAESVAKPEKIPIKAVPFACTDEVINLKADRDALHSHLCGSLPESTHFGIEMEGTGIASFGKSPVVVIKAISDYSDERKSDWPPGLKMLFQLYAAETAAEYVAQTIRAL